MNTKTASPKRLSSAAGFSLVELMVAVTLALVILVAVSAIFVNSKRSYHTQDRLARLQENARFAVQYLTRDIRMAGYSGCMSDITNITNTLNVTTPPTAANYLFNASVPIEGLENAAGNWYPSAIASLPAGIKAGTDALLVRFADPIGGVDISDPMPNESAELKVSSVAGVSPGDIIMVSDCSSADVMQITGVQGAALKLQHAPGGGNTPGNATQKLSKVYAPPAKIIKFKMRVYYIKERADRTPALYMQENGDPLKDYELVEDVEDLQITYGVDTDATRDGIPNSYRKPGEANLVTGADWGRVKSVRIGLLVRAANANDADVDIRAGTSVDVNGTPFAIPVGDRFQRRVFGTTILPRNL